jgi:hypothetical protein
MQWGTLSSFGKTIGLSYSGVASKATLALAEVDTLFQNDGHIALDAGQAIA